MKFVVISLLDGRTAWRKLDSQNGDPCTLERRKIVTDRRRQVVIDTLSFVASRVTLESPRVFPVARRIFAMIPDTVPVKFARQPSDGGVEICISP